MPDILPSRGRPGMTLLMTVRRELTHEDVMRLATQGKAKVAAPMIQRLRASHHRAAREIAQGKDANEVATLVGRTPQRIRDLMKDPAFTNLVTYYHEQYTETTIDQAQTLQETWIDIAQLATDEIIDRLEDPSTLKTIPVAELRQLATTGSDRTVAPPLQATPVAQPPITVTFNMGLNQLKQNVIDVTPEKDE